MKYDIFINYRRTGGKDYARTLKYKLEDFGYNVFLDFDELKDGKFDAKILKTIASTPIFITILSPGVFDRCVNDDDWVRTEIECAVDNGCKIIPIDPDGRFGNMPENLPEKILKAFEGVQYSKIDTESLFEESINKMVKERISPIVKPRKKSGAWILSILILVCVAIVGGIFLNDFAIKNKAERAKKAEEEAIKSDASTYSSMLSRFESGIATGTSMDTLLPYRDSLAIADSLAELHAGHPYAALFTGTDELRLALNDKLQTLYASHVSSAKVEFDYHKKFGKSDTETAQNARFHATEALKYMPESKGMKEIIIALDNE